MKLPLVSILMTAFNREKYIAEAIESALQSTYQHFEIIITDNCSTDNTVQIAEEYAAKDSRIRVYRNKENIGQFPNRNYAASLAKGEYLKYLDSDDKLYPFGLDILVRRAVEFPEAGMILSNPVLDEKIPYPEFLDPREAYRQFYLTDEFPSVGPSFLLIKKEAFDAVNGFTVPGYAGTDVEFMLQIAALFPIIKAEAGTAWYRQHAGQEIQQAFRTYEYELKQFQVFSALLLDEKCPLSKEEREQAMHKLKRQNIRRIFRFLSQFKIDLAKKLYGEIKPSFTDTVRAFGG